MSSVRQQLKEREAQLEKELLASSRESLTYRRIYSELLLAKADLQAQGQWTVVPLFWIGLVAAIAGVIAAYYSYLTYSQPQQPPIQSSQPASAPIAPH